MRILLLVHAFNSLSQRLHIELRRWGHDVTVEFDINNDTTEQAVELAKPELIIAPYLKRAIPDSVWCRIRCIVVHPGIIGDRGPSSLDWAILNEEKNWGVTCIEANAEMDAGAIWASVPFTMRQAKKSSLYRNEVTEAAIEAVQQTIARIESNCHIPTPLNYRDDKVFGRWQRAIKQTDRQIDWVNDSTDYVIRKINSADGTPGLLISILSNPVYIYNAHPTKHYSGQPGHIIGKRNEAICIATKEAAVWVSHLRIAYPVKNQPAFKLPAIDILKVLSAPFEATIPHIDCKDSDTESLYKLPETSPKPEGDWQEIYIRQRGPISYLYFDFYNGAMSTDQCKRLKEAYEQLLTCNSRVIVLMGGDDFWSNGIDLNTIEAAESPAEASWQNINAMNDLCEKIINTMDKITVSAIRGNAGAGGFFLSLAADYVFAHRGSILNPHYKGMGNLYGSEYWSYRLPLRVGDELSKKIINGCLPMGALEASEIGLIDDAFGYSRQEFIKLLENRLLALSEQTLFNTVISKKRIRRATDEKTKPLAQYRAEELAKMKLNFFGFDPSYHVARYHFVHNTPRSRTPSYLARHRNIDSEPGELKH